MNTRTLARILTNVLNPFVIFTVLFAALSFSEVRFLTGLGYVFLELLAAAFVAGYVFLMRRKKRVGEFWIPTRSERIVPAIFLLSSFAGLLVALFAFGAPDALFFLTLSMGLASGTVALMTFFWKASAHSAVAGHAAMAGTLLFGVLGAVFVLVLPVVIWARTRPGAHTISQTLVGAFVGGVFAFLFLG
ncbi:MAG: hypothetical protein ACRDSJ_08315 [Rubrobacteraceae bacterium]